MFSALARGQTPLPKRADGLVLDLSQSNSRTHATSSKTPNSLRTVPAFAASASASDGVEPRFNDPLHSDVKIEVVNGKGDIYALLHLHSNVLREQSDYFFNTLVKRALRDSSSISEPPTTFTIQTSRQVPDPEIYVTVFRLFYQEEEFISEDIVCMGSVWKVLQVLVVSAELQFHSCTAACVDYLESVPWNDEELEDIVRLVPQLDRLQDAQPVLERLPMRTWDEESIAESLRILLIRAVAFHDATGQGPITPKGKGLNPATFPTAISFSMPSPQARASQNTEGSQTPHQFPPGKAERSSPIPGSIECREAVCSILRNHQGPLLPLKTKKVLLRETFVDLLQCLWSEQKSFADKSASTKSSQTDLRSPSKLSSQDGPPGLGGEANEEQNEKLQEDKAADGDHREMTESQEEEKNPRLVVHAGNAPLPLFESIYGKFGALTWITGLMIEFSMADEVFKWLASDKVFFSQALGLYQSTQSRDESGTDGGVANTESQKLLSSVSIVRSVLLNLATAILAKRLVVNAQLRSNFVHIWVPVLAEICTTSTTQGYLIYGLPVTAEEKATILAGYNELVLTLPASDQHSVFQLWYLKLSLTLPASSSTPRPQASTPRILSQSASQKMPPPGVDAEGNIIDPGSTWFTLAPAYKRWLMRLGTPCGVPGGGI